ncbi:enoyl-CoA-hydratase DpgB [Amycolatopsis lurida]
MASSNKTPVPPALTAERLSLPGGGPLTSSLVLAINEFCDRIDALSGNTVAVIEVGEAGEAGTAPHQAWPGDVSIHLVSRWERAVRRVERLRATTIAAAGGTCAGPALELLLATDYRLAAAGTRLHLPSESGGFWPGMVLHRLANQIGGRMARRLLLHPAELSAAEAAGWGLVDEVGEDLTAAVDRVVSALAPVDGAEFAIRRRLLLDAPTTTFEDALGVHLAACDRVLRRAQAGTESRLPA